MEAIFNGCFFGILHGFYIWKVTLWYNILPQIFKKKKKMQLFWCTLPNKKICIKLIFKNIYVYLCFLVFIIFLNLLQEQEPYLVSKIDSHNLTDVIYDILL